MKKYINPTLDILIVDITKDVIMASGGLLSEDSGEAAKLSIIDGFDKIS